MSDEHLWQTKLAARIHDPAEKALVLLRDPAGHEGGSIVGIGKALGFETRDVPRRDGSTVEKLDLPPEMARIVARADHWASAADRAQFPKDDNDRFVRWAQVRFAEEGEIINPLAPQERYTVPRIGQDVLAAHIRTASEDLFKSLIHRDAGGTPDHRLTSLAFWRFGPELGRKFEGIGSLWGLLPADTRTPDHTIWQHLDLASALAGAMADGGRPALLTLSIGPVQEFIAAGRSTSDLWAGSHFLSALAWQALQTVVERYGPDAILFPQLRGVPAVDVWLIEQGVEPGLFEGASWNEKHTDYNPLFVAALSNRFVAVVPEKAAAGLAASIRERLREWVQTEARAMLDRVLGEIDEMPDGQHCYAQLTAQLCDFPQVHWSAVPWLPAQTLEEALAPFYPDDGKRPGLFAQNAWEMLTAPIEPERGWRFWEPNDGTLYPAVYDLGDRLLAAAKSARPFGQLKQKGYRDSLTGEHEWLTLEEAQLQAGSPRSRTDTLWARIAKKRPAWAKQGEHLSAFGLIKRLWPEHFAETLKSSRWYQQLDNKPDLSRYVVSTHVMALAPSLERLLVYGPADIDAFDRLANEVAPLERPALPRRLMRRELRDNRQRWETATKLPAYLERTEEECAPAEAAERVEQRLSRIEHALGAKVERYYALLLMDGDRLGAWLSGANTLRFGDTFHTRVKSGLATYGHEALDWYLAMERPISPARHMAISTALNGFALDLVRHVVEDVSVGKLLYAGGDDVMAMLSVRDLLRGMALLRTVYSGGMPAGQGMPFEARELRINRGFVEWRGRLYLAMGERATASCGAVVAHHQAPLAAVLRELRAAEQRAKNEGRRNAFSVTVIKRSGGALTLTENWGEPVKLLNDLIAFLRTDGVSRRAVYNTLEWLTDIPEPRGAQKMLEAMLSYQFDRQIETAKKHAVLARHDVPRLAQSLSSLSANREGGLDWLRNFLSVAEFLARETRSGAAEPAPRITTQERGDSA
jgi:CRISPR-associated protein Cmr2